MNPSNASEPSRTEVPAKPGHADAKLLARSKRDAMRGRARRIRRGVSAVAATVFAAAFLAVYVQLASGHDPALSASSKAKSSTSLLANVSSSKDLAAEKAAAAKQAAKERSKRAAAAKTTAAKAAAAKAAAAEREAQTSEAAASTESATPVTTSQS